MNNNSEEKHRKDLEAAKNWYKIAEQQNNEVAMNILKDLFPELRESEDERIRKEIIAYLKQRSKSGFNQEVRICNDGIAWLEKQAEQKPVDKVEPKFKVGDWIVDNEDKEKFCVIKVRDNTYRFIDVEENEYDMPKLYEAEDEYHLWTIQDAKEGDVLVSHECLVLFKHIEGLNVMCYCTYHYLNNESFCLNTLHNKTAFIPATKKECDVLFSKMKEAGYEWDSEKKALKKIEQKHAEWSEEDEYQINTILHGLDLKRELYKKEGNQVEEKRYKTQYDWLKSLKPQNHWKPTEQNIKDLEWCADLVKEKMGAGFHRLQVFIDELKNF